MHFFNEELSSQETNFIGNRVAVLEGTGLIGDVTLDDTHHFLFRNRDVGFADAVADMLDRNGLAIRRIEGLIDVVDEFGIRIVERVELEDDLLGQTGTRRRDTTGSGQVDVIVVAHLLDVTNLEDGPVNVTIETIAQLLCHVAQVQVVVGNLAQIDVLAEIRVRGVGSTIEDSLCICQIAIGRLTRRGTREDGHLKLAAGLMLCHSDFC